MTTSLSDIEQRRRCVDWSIVIANAMFILLLFGAMCYLAYGIHLMQIESASRLEHAASERASIREESQRQRRAVMDINAAQTRLLMELNRETIKMGEDLKVMRQEIEAKAIANR